VVAVIVSLSTLCLALSGSQRQGERLADGNLRRAAGGEGEVHTPFGGRRQSRTRIRELVAPFTLVPMMLARC
jgi:hypothetical protein